jgi:hypothetical protein
MSSLRKAFIKDESGNPVWAKAHLSSVYGDNGTPLSTTLNNIESTTYVPTLSIEPSSSTMEDEVYP